MNPPPRGEDMQEMRLREFQELSENEVKNAESIRIMSEDGERLGVLVIPPPDPQARDYSMLRAENIAETADSIKPKLEARRVTSGRRK